MIKKLGLWLMLFSLVIQLLPPGSASVVTAATSSTSSFTFPNERMTASTPRIVTDERVTITGSTNAVDSSTISYTVKQVTSVNGTELAYSKDNVRADLTSNIYAEGNAITVYNIQLFPGLNEVTFKGIRSGGEVTSSFYIEYRDSPMLYNLVANLDGSSFPMTENDTTVVYSNASKGKTSANISITGNAPNATGVTVIVNGSSKTYTVNKNNNSSFAASPLSLKQGKNIVTFQISNGTQIMTSTRSVAFYNGKVTFYDVDIDEYTNAATPALVKSVNLESTSKFIADKANNLIVTGRMIIPNTPVSTNGTVTAANPNIFDPTVLSGLVTPALTNVTQTNAQNSTIAPPIVPGSLQITKSATATMSDAFFVIDYTFKLPAISTSAGAETTNVTYKDLFSLRLSAQNSSTSATESGSFSFTLLDSSEPFIKSINYYPGYIGSDGNSANGDEDVQSYQNIPSVPLEGSSIYGLPLAVEVLVGNTSTSNYAGIALNQIEDVYGNIKKPKSASNPNGLESGVGKDYEVLTIADPAYQTVNIDGQLYTRVIYKFNKMPFEGTQTISFDIMKDATTALSNSTTSAKLTMLYGPYVNYTSMYDGMILYDDTTSALTSRKQAIIDTAFKNFQGAFNNINDTSELNYDGTNALKTVFFYVNNVLIPLKQNGSDIRSFILQKDKVSGDNYYYNLAFEALFSGENKIRIVYQGKKNYYEKTIKINIVPTNLPLIPYDEQSGIFPFTYTVDDVKMTPIYNDANFKLTNGVYTTKEMYANIYGTFDFIDLGNGGIDNIANSNQTIVTNIEQALTTIKANGSDLSQYILKVTGTTLGTEGIKWDLNGPLQLYNKTTYIGTANNTALNYDSNLIVRYDLSTESFAFILKKQELNADGSSSAYVFSVYNSGLYGPKASYRVEIDPTVLPYKIIRPALPAEGIVNKNFVEFVINANGADTVVVNKLNATKSGYDTNNDGDLTDSGDFPNAFRVTVTGLKTGANKITFTITNKNDSVTDTVTITYQPTNIPGAQYLEDMKSSHKVFDGALSLTFQKGTSLIRSDYNVPANLKGQVFTGHKLLFGIANPEDGVLDRREYDDTPAGYDLLVQNLGTQFRVSFPTRFGKASPVYWIDAGLADNLSTTSYDPVKTGIDPYQYPGNLNGPNNTTLPTFDDREDDQLLMASKRGTLTLSFDPNIRDNVGTMVTVFRYDPDIKNWENLGGVVDTGKNTITVPFTKFGYYVVGKMSYSFNDASNHPYARNFLEAMYSKGIMNATSLDDFGADMYTTRGEFARMIIEALDMELNYDLDNPHFDDVAPIINTDALWDYRYIETAAREGIIRGTQPKTFEPNNSLTRGEAAVVLARALDLKLDTDNTKIDKALQKAFKDYANISYYAKSSVIAIAKKGYIQGSPVDAADPKKGYVFESQSYLLRSDAAIIIGKVMADLKKLPKLN